MSSGSLARRYAKALMQLAEEQGNLARTGSEVRALADTIAGSSELIGALSNPILARSDRGKIVDAVLAKLGASTTVKNFAALLLDRERIIEVPNISRELDAMIDAKLGRVNAEVTCAAALSPAQLAELKKVLEKLSGRQVDMKTHQDPSLLGGVVAKVGDVVYDGSLKTQLDEIRNSLAG